MKRFCIIGVVVVLINTSLGIAFQSSKQHVSSSSPPVFGAVGCSQKTGTTADIFAGVYTNGVPTTCYFEWGTTTTYGSQSSPILLFDSTTWYQQADYSVQNLTPNTLYHFRAVAQDTMTQFNVYSLDYTFFTTNAYLVTLPADSVTTSAAILYARCNPNGMKMNVFFRYGLDPSAFEEQTPMQLLNGDTTEVDVSFILYGLTPNTTYYFIPEANFVDHPPAFINGETKSFTTLVDPYERGFVIPLTLKNHFGVKISGPRLFGVHSHATYCRDIGLGEHEFPPYPPAGSPEIRFIDVHGLSNCMGLGLYLDLRHYFNPAQVDTYMVHLQADNSGYPVILSWSDLNAHYAGPVRLLDPYTGTLLNTDMKSQTSDTIPSPFDQLLIMAQGPINLVASRIDALTGSSVALEGAFNPGGMQTQGWFEWGDTTEYAHTTPTYDLGNGTSPTDFAHTLTDLQADFIYHFRVVTQNSLGTFYGADQMFKTNSVTSVGGENELPTTFALHQNYPNPFNPSTTIRYDLSVSSHVILKLYNVLGQQVKVLADEVQSPGAKSVRVDASDLNNGVYFYRINAGKFSDTKKMILMK